MQERILFLGELFVNKRCHWDIAGIVADLQGSVFSCFLKQVMQAKARRDVTSFPGMCQARTDACTFCLWLKRKLVEFYLKKCLGIPGTD